MHIRLQKADETELPEILDMQHQAFKDLLEKYQDYETNPGAEHLEQIRRRFLQEQTTYYFIVYNTQKVGAIRFLLKDNGIGRISPMFIVPEYQNMHIGYGAVEALEALYPSITKWELDTIVQEKALCHFYEKLAYVDTGRREAIQPGMDIIFHKKVVH
jgi:GNAT superfamily N-acetyltransferase